jgi:predicted RNase H-like nuclease (RuvC/YqgF family)
MVERMGEEVKRLQGMAERKEAKIGALEAEIRRIKEEASKQQRSPYP